MLKTREKFQERKGKHMCSVSEIKGAPGVHISEAGCTIFGGVHPECARFFENLSLLHVRRVHGDNPGCTVLGEVHPVGAQNKTLISDTGVSLTLLKTSIKVQLITSFSKLTIGY